jgi:prepilin-type N-terminal cleavage/methylation domain-containing protein
MESSRLLTRLFRKRRHLPTRGFTLIEMLVVTAIIIIVTGTVLVGQGSFNRSVILTDTTYTLALSIRQAQSFGLSSRTFTNRQTSISYNNTGYGIHLDRSTPTSYVFYADVNPEIGGSVSANCPGHSIIDPSSPEARPGNCLYDGPAGGELVQTYAFSHGYSIVKFCGYVGIGSGATAYCSDNGGLQALDMSFERPNTSSVLIGVIGNEFTGFPSLVSQNFTSVCIQISPSDNSNSNYVKITQLGQVSVGSSCTP